MKKMMVIASIIIAILSVGILVADVNEDQFIMEGIRYIINHGNRQCPENYIYPCNNYLNMMYAYELSFTDIITNKDSLIFAVMLDKLKDTSTNILKTIYDVKDIKKYYTASRDRSPNRIKELWVRNKTEILNHISPEMSSFINNKLEDLFILKDGGAIEGNANFVYQFWERRKQENNVDVVYDILLEVYKHINKIDYKNSPNYRALHAPVILETNKKSSPQPPTSAEGYKGIPWKSSVADVGNSGLKIQEIGQNYISISESKVYSRFHYRLLQVPNRTILGFKMIDTEMVPKKFSLYKLENNDDTMTFYDNQFYMYNFQVKTANYNTYLKELTKKYGKSTTITSTEYISPENDDDIIYYNAKRFSKTNTSIMLIKERHVTRSLGVEGISVYVMYFSNELFNTIKKDIKDIVSGKSRNENEVNRKQQETDLNKIE